MGQNQFSEVSRDLGVNLTFKKWTLGNGISFCDFDQDGWEDITLGSPSGEQLYFYKNEKGVFNRISIPSIFNNYDSKQVIWVDYDNDNDLDLFIAAYDGINKLYQNNGKLEFEDITSQVGLPEEIRRSYGAIWGDYNRDGWLDLYVSYRNTTIGVPHENRLYMNVVGHFTDVSIESNSLDMGRVPFCSGFVDFNNDLWPDIYTANDRFTGNTVLMNNRNGSFTALTTERQGAVDMDGMSVSPSDYNRDGWVDIYITNSEPGNVFLQNQTSVSDPSWTLEDIAEATGTTINSVNWCANFFDYDNDGLEDLYVNGAIGGSTYISNAMFKNELDTFRLIREPWTVADTNISYVSAIGDIDNDGHMDFVQQNSFPQRIFIWHNNGSKNHWIKIFLTGVKSNLNAVGAIIQVYTNNITQTKAIYCGQGFLAQNSFMQHFGVAEENLIDSVIITWPTGHKDRFVNLNADQTYHFVEGQSTDGIINIDTDIDIVSSSIDPYFDSDGVSIFPNPTSDKIHVQVSTFAIVSIQLMNQQGNTQYLNPRDTTFDLSQYPAGIYWLQIMGANNHQITKRIVKF